MSRRRIGMLKKLRGSEGGFAILEILACMLLVAILSLAVGQNTVMALKVAKFTEANHAASSLAISKIEELAAIDTLNLDSSYNSTETSLAWESTNLTFTRTVTVTTNADDSRTVRVVVTSNNSTIPTTVDFSTSFALWE